MEYTSHFIYGMMYSELFYYFCICYYASVTCKRKSKKSCVTNMYGSRNVLSN